MAEQETHEVRLPAVGSVEEATIVVWLKEVGDQVEVDEPICEVETDKADMEINSPVAGRIAEITAAAEETVAVDTVIARIAIGDAAAAEGAPTPAPAPQPAAEPAPAPASEPAAAKVDLPTGYEDLAYELRPNDRVRKATAAHMTRSLQTSAHLLTEVYVDMSAVAEARRRANEAAADGQRLSYLPFIAVATCAALREHPVFNATFEEEQTILWGVRNLGIAVDTPRGLFVPVVRDADSLSPAEIGARIATLAEGAREGTLTPDELSGATFTISNQGSFGAATGMAIINQPQVAILGTPAIIRRPWVATDAEGNETIEVRPIMNLALTYDHRAVDGGEASRFLTRLKGLLEEAAA